MYFTSHEHLEFERMMRQIPKGGICHSVSSSTLAPFLGDTEKKPKKLPDKKEVKAS